MFFKVLLSELPDREFSVEKVQTSEEEWKNGRMEEEWKNGTKTKMRDKI